MKYLSFFLFLSFFLSFSCEKSSPDLLDSATIESQYDGIFNFPTSGVDGHIVVVSNQLEGHDLPANFHISGNLKDGNGIPLNWSELSVAGIKLSPEVARSGEVRPGRVSAYFSSRMQEEDYNKLYASFDRRELDFKLNNRQEKLRLPSIIKLDLSANDLFRDNESRFSKVSRNEDLIIRWNPERDLEKTTDDKVGVYVVYNAEPSRHYIDDNLPADNQTIFKTSEDDTGEIVFTPSEMLDAGFPDKGLITIIIGKSSSHLLDFLDFEIIVGGVTYEASDYIQLID